MSNYDEVGINNLALTMLSTSRISSLTEDSENARKCNAIYEMTRDNLLSQHYWNFALKEASLASTGDTPTVEDWSYIYQLPTDCITIVYQYDDYPYAVIGDKLYSNDSTAVIRYVAKTTNPVLFSKGFVIALATRLAADLAYGITQNATLSKAMEAKAQIALKEAKWTDAQQGQGNVPIGSSFIDERGQ
ncbi:MAG: hypothetical protein U9O94_10685 [Nanoarchaeota archaeon]|nr:hypothetical protein [Nanoarchaeota archaeon]